MNAHIQLESPGGGLCAPLNVHTLVGNPGLHPAKSLQSMPPDVHVGMGLGTVQPLSVPCSIAMNFAPGEAGKVLRTSGPIGYLSLRRNRTQVSGLELAQ